MGTGTPWLSPLVPNLLVGHVLGHADGRLLQLLRVLEQQRVAQAGPQEEVARLQRHHLRVKLGGFWGVPATWDGWGQGRGQPRGLTQVVSTLAAALSKWKERTLRIPSVISVRT